MRYIPIDISGDGGTVFGRDIAPFIKGDGGTIVIVPGGGIGSLGDDSDCSA